MNRYLRLFWDFPNRGFLLLIVLPMLLAGSQRAAHAVVPPPQAEIGKSGAVVAASSLVVSLSPRVQEDSDATETAETASETELKAAVDRSHHGFLPTRGSIMLDFVAVAMVLILPILWFSVSLARAGKYPLHRTIQIGTAIALLAAVVLFEVDMRFFTNWRQLAEASPLYQWCSILLWIHLAFAIPTPFLWAVVIFGALRDFDSTFQGPYNARHRSLGKLAAWLMYATGLTGILFYVVAFVL